MMKSIQRPSNDVKSIEGITDETLIEGYSFITEPELEDLPCLGTNFGTFFLQTMIEKLGELVQLISQSTILN